MSREDQLQGVAVAVLLEDRPGRIRQVSSVPVRSRAVIARRREGRFRISSDGAGREREFGVGGDRPCESVAAVCVVVVAVVDGMGHYFFFSSPFLTVTREVWRGRKEEEGPPVLSHVSYRDMGRGNFNSDGRRLARG